MNRKDFLSVISPLVAATAAFGASPVMAAPAKRNKIPPYLKKGDVIGITCPSGFITLEDIQPAVGKLKEWGFEIRIGSTVGKKDFTLGGTDEERTADFQNMLDDSSIDAILLGRGGYGAVRIIDQIDFKKFSRHPKWIIGFSDATVFHCHLNHNYGIASIHSKMCNSFPKDWSLAEPVQVDSIDSIRKCLYGDKMEYTSQTTLKNKPGSSEGILTGGNLSIIQNMAGSKSEINTRGKILFLEEIDEYLYSMDRMLWNLKRSGKFDELKGLIIGGFKAKPDDPGEEFGKTVYDMVMEKTKEYDYPVCFDFPIGHQKNNFALKCGIVHHLEVTETGATLSEKW